MPGKCLQALCSKYIVAPVTPYVLHIVGRAARAGVVAAVVLAQQAIDLVVT